MRTLVVLLITALVVASSSINKHNKRNKNNNNNNNNNNNGNSDSNESNNNDQRPLRRGGDISSSDSEERLSQNNKIRQNAFLYRPSSHHQNNKNMMPELESLAEVQAYGLMQAFLAPNITKQSEDEDEREHRQQHGGITDNNNLISRRAGGETWDPKLFAKRAIQFWVQKEFLKYYRKYSLILTSTEITSAQQTYNKFKLESYESKGKAGVVINLDIDKLKGIVDLWQKSDLVSQNDAQQMKYVIDAQQAHQVDGDYVLKRSDGTLVFTRFAFINTATTTTGIQTGSIVYMFHSYQFKVTMDVTTSRTSVCFLWGIICVSKVTVTSKPLSGEEATNMGNFMKIQASRDYDENIGSYLEYLNKEANRYERFQPKDFKDDWDKIKQQPDADPGTVLPNKNALDPKNYQV